jgi:hypothetical protein
VLGAARRIAISSTGTTTLNAAAATAPFIANIGASEVTRIDSSGRLLVGTSTYSGGTRAVFRGNTAAPGTQGVIVLQRDGANPGTTQSLGEIRFVDSNDGFGASISATPDGGWSSPSDCPTKLVFSTTADGASSPTERLRITSAGNVGIGTSSPGEQLDVSSGTGGVIRVTSSDGSISAAGERIGKIEMYSSDGSSNGTGIAAYIEAVSQAAFTGQGRPTHLTFGTYNSGGSLGERVRITDAGNVGIGTTSPGFTLDIKAATNGLLRVNNSNESSHGSADARIVAGGSFYQNPVIVGSSIKFNTFNGSSEGERVRITSAGLVGIGTSSPISDIHILGTTGARIQNSADTDGQFLLTYSSNNPDFRMLDTTGTTTVKLLASGNSYFNGGNVGIGTTSPTELLHLSNGAAGDAVTIKVTNSGDSNANTTCSILAQQGVRPGGEIVFGRENANAWNSAAGYADGFISFSPVRAGSNIEAARLDSDGRLLVGTSSAPTNVYPTTAAVTPSTVFDSDSNQLSFMLNNNSPSGNIVAFARRYTAAANGTIARLIFPQYDGTNYRTAAQIAAEIDGTPGTADMPGRLMFSTTSDGASSPTERLRIDSSGRVGIGTTPNSDSRLHVKSGVNDSNPVLRLEAATNNFLNFRQTGSVYDIHVTAGDPLSFTIGASERARIDSSGRLLVGTSSTSASASAVFQGYGGTPTGPALLHLCAGTATPTAELGYIVFGNSSQNEGATITAWRDGGTWTSGSSHPSRLVFSTTADGASSPTERMRINAGGNFLINQTTTDDPAGTNTQGLAFGSAGWISNCRDGATPVLIGRKGSDGTLVEFFQDGTVEGSISVSGTTVSYNGAHLSRWSQLPSGAERTEILRGTVLSNIDEMCEWTDEENEQLNRMKVSDVEGDKNVSGVFQAWDDDDDTYTNDFYCAMTGDFIIRIGAGVTVERGDLLMSAGDGTAKPQDDDIIRSKTIAKVTSTNVSCTYDDGSYCVPCVLMAC